MANPSLASLPDKVASEILSFHQGDYFTLSRLKRTCSCFRQLLTKESKLWKVRGYDCEFQEARHADFEREHETTWWEVARRLAMIQKIKHEQGNRFESIFMEEINDMKAFLELNIRKNGWGDIELEFEEGALLAFCSLVEANFIEYMEKNYLFDLFTRSGGHILLNDWHLTDIDTFQLQNNGRPQLPSSAWPELTWDGDPETFEQQHGGRNRLVRRLAYRAGIAEMAEICFMGSSSIWLILCGYLRELLRLLIAEHRAIHPEEDGNEQPVTIPVAMVHRAAKRAGFRYHMAYLSKHGEGNDDATDGDYELPSVLSDDESLVWDESENDRTEESESEDMKDRGPPTASLPSIHSQKNTVASAKAQTQCQECLQRQQRLNQQKEKPQKQQPTQQQQQHRQHQALMTGMTFLPPIGMAMGMPMNPMMNPVMGCPNPAVGSFGANSNTPPRISPFGMAMGMPMNPMMGYLNPAFGSFGTNLNAPRTSHPNVQQWQDSNAPITSQERVQQNQDAPPQAKKPRL